MHRRSQRALATWLAVAIVVSLGIAVYGTYLRLFSDTAAATQVAQQQRTIVERWNDLDALLFTIGPDTPDAQLDAIVIARDELAASTSSIVTVAGPTDITTPARAIPPIMDRELRLAGRIIDIWRAGGATTASQLIVTDEIINERSAIISQYQDALRQQQRNPAMREAPQAQRVPDPPKSEVSVTPNATKDDADQAGDDPTKDGSTTPKMSSSGN